MVLLVFFALSTLFFSGPAGSVCRAATGSPGSTAVLAGCEEDFKPYSFVDEKGHPAGFGVELLTAVARAMDIPIRIVPGTWDTVWHGLVKGKLDALPVVAKLPSRVSMVEFSLPHTETFDAFIVRKGAPLLRDIREARGKEVIVLRSDAAHHALLEHGFEGKIVPVATIAEMLALLKSGKHDAVLYPKLLGIMEIRERGIRGLSVGPPLPDYKRVFSFAVKNGDQELLEKLNQGLLIVKASGEYDRIFEKWLLVNEPWHKLEKYFVPALLIGLAVILSAGLWLFMLHLLIGKRTKELEEAKKSLLESNATLEQRIAERTAKLQVANAALRKSEQQLQLVLDASSLGTFEFDVLTGEGRWNDLEFELLGLTPGEAPPGPETFFRYVHPEDAGFLRKQWAKTLRVGRLDAEFRIVRPDGEVRWLAGKGRLVSGDETGAAPLETSGQALRFLGVNYDISRRKRAEAALRESELFYRQTLDSIPGMVFTTRPDGYCDYQSQQWVDFTGVPMSEHVGDGWNKLLHPEDRPRAFAAWRAAVEGRAPYDLEYRVRRYDGAYEWFKVRGRPIHNAAGEIVRWFGTALNIDHLLKTQEALRASEEHVRLKLNSILSPAGDIGNLELADIIDAPAIQALVDNLYKFVHLPVGILDLKGKALIGAGWQDICTRFHRVHPETCGHCLESDLELTKGVPAGEFRLYRCKNGMWDAVTPIMVGGRHMGNLFWGQFFFKDEPVDREFFRAQALQYGFNEEEYLAALERVPRISRETLDAGMAFYLKLADMLSRLSYSNVQLARSLSEGDILLHSLRESEEGLKRAQEIAHLGSWEFDFVTNKLSWSDEAYRIFGLQPQEFAATYEAFLEVVHPGDRAAVNEGYVSSLREGRDGYEIEHRLVRKATGQIRYVHEKCRNFRDETGKVIRSTGMVHDLTEQKQVEREREITVEFLHLVNSSAATGDLLKSATTFFQGQSGCEALGLRLKTGDDFPYFATCGFSQDFVLAENSLCARDAAGDLRRDAAGNPVLACMCGNIIGGRFDPDKEFFSKGGSFWTNSITELLANTAAADLQACTRNRCQGEGYESVALIPLRIGQERLGLLQLNDRRKGMFSPETIVLWERLAGYLSIALVKFRAEEEIITLNEELALKISELEFTNRELESFIYSVSHDLRAPLRSISSFVSFLKKDYADRLDDRAKDYLRRISNGFVKMNRLVEDMLHLSKVSRQEVNREAVDINRVACSVIADLREADPERRVEVVVQEEVTAFADPWLMEIVFSNLLGNAWKFTALAENPRIELGTDTRNGQTVYYVRDNGAGFDQEYAGQMFLPFHRLHSEEEFEGTGIGLAIVERIILRHGGRIWAEGEPGKGATLFFTLG